MEKYLIYINTSEITGVPDTVKILPLGFVKSQKGDFVVDEESVKLIRNAFLQRGIDIVIDYEHQTLENVQAPAGGWIKDIFVEDGAIVAKVEWTSKAAEYLKNKEYRYLSPVVAARKSDRKAVMLHSVALTNTPAIDGMFAIVNSVNLNEFEGGNKMDPKELAVLLGLPEDATQDQITAAIKALSEKAAALVANNTVVANKTVCDLLGVKEDAKTEDVTAAIMALKSEVPEGAVSQADFLALKADMDSRKADEAVTLALKAGKITPAQQEWAKAYALKDEAGFAGFVDKAPQVVPMGEVAYDASANRPSASGSEEELKVCKMMGISKEDLEKYGKDVE